MPKTPPPTEQTPETETAHGKGRATPTRAESQAGRRRPLVANTKEARKEARAEMNVRRDRARAGMAAGEERYLPARDKGPQRKMVRDYVDSRWHIAEWIMPMMIVVIVLMMVGIPQVMVYAYLLLWTFVTAAIINMIIVGIRARKSVIQRFGAERTERGLRWYAAMRTMQLRALRLPKPQVKRGEKTA